MTQMKTPGVYIVEQNAFPNSVVEVATAVPAFIGYTEKAVNGTQSLLNKPFRITSFADYMRYFGGAPERLFELTELPDKSTASERLILNKTHYLLERFGVTYRLYDAMRFFYGNGGGACYIVSVGDYKNGITAGLLDGTDLNNPGGGLMTLEKEQEPTMVLVPDALSLDSAGCYTVYQNFIAHCRKMMSRIAILDVYDGYQDRKDPEGDVINTFRGNIGNNGLSYAAAYYPWLETTFVNAPDISFESLTEDSLPVLQQVLLEEQGLSATSPPDEGTKQRQIFDLITGLTTYKETGLSAEELNKSLVSLSLAYKSLVEEIRNRLNVLPPASAMAGIYTMVDNTRGVWKAPANVSLNGVVRPLVNITHEDQADLNAPLDGKSINAIRSFVGQGVVVWGARTLDGNSLDYRYINVRRTMMMLEQSVKLASKAYVFEPNNSITWVTVKSMIENFLFSQWKRGALVGSKPDQGYSVHV